METEDNSKNITDYLQIIKRRKKIIIIPMLVLFIISCIFTLILPPLYRSEAIIFIEQQSIPLDMVRSTVVSYADQRIRQIEKNLMSINNLGKIINDFNLYPHQKNKVSLAELAYKFREQTHIEIGNEDVIIKGRRSTATLSFKLAFEHKNPATAQKVASRLVNFFIEEDKRERTRKAKDTTTFLDEEADKFIVKIKKMEIEIAKYKEKNSRSLPELLAVNLGTTSRIEANLLQLESQEKILLEKEIVLQSQLLVISPVLLSTDGSVPDSLPALEERYNLLLSKYSKSHPDVKAAKRLIDNFEAPKGVKNVNANINNPAYIQLQNDIKFTTMSLKNISKQKLELTQKLKETELYIAKTPEVERKYFDLMRNLETNKSKYQDLNSKALEARLSQTLEEEQKAEKFAVIDPPIVPTKPEKPNRLKLLLMGFAVSIAGGLGVGLLVELTEGRVRGYKSLATLIGTDPMIVIPYIKNQDDLDKEIKDKKIMTSIIIGFVLLLVFIISIHLFYQPLYILSGKLLLKLGV